MFLTELNKSSVDKIQFGSVVLVSILLAFKVPSAFIALPSLVLILSFALNKFRLSWKSLHISKEGYLLTILFAIHGLWFIKSIVETGSFSYFEKTLPLLAFPLMMSSTSSDKTKLKSVYLFFAYGVLTSYTLSMVAAIYNYFYSIPPWGRPSDFFFHEQFTKGLFDIHPTYYGLLGVIATLCLLNIASRWYHYLLILTLTVFLVLINARIILFVQIALVVYSLVKFFLKGITWHKVALLTAIVIAFFVLIQVANSVYDYQHRKMLLNVKTSWERSFAKDINDGDGGLVTRFAIWRAAFEVIRENPVLGVGLDFEKEALASVFRKTEVPWLVDNFNNSHNQFLSFLISFGLIGTVLIVAYFVVLLRHAYKKRSWIYFEFMAIIVIVCLTESIFNRGLGIAIFAFFNSLFFLKVVNDNK